MSTLPQGPTVMAIVIVSIVIFLVLRFVVCWYFKINERVDLLKDIRDCLELRKEPDLTSKHDRGSK